MSDDKYTLLLKEAEQRFKDELDRRDKVIEELKENNTILRYELQQLRDKTFKPKPPKDKEPPAPKPTPKKKGAKFGHLGWFRKKPKKVNSTEIVTLKKCPLCGDNNLSDCRERSEHIQEDIVLPKIKVTKYIHHHYYCPGCKNTVIGRGKEEIPGSYIGPNAKSLANFLRYDIKTSVRDVKRVLKHFSGLTVVPGSVTGFNNQLRRRSMTVYEELKVLLRKSPYCHGDETGWKLDGDKYWLWSFSNNEIALVCIDKSRGQKVVEKVLGAEYDGILISDFLSAYNRIKTKGKQRCITHLERDLKKVRACDPSEPVRRYCKNLLSLLEQARKLDKNYTDKKIDINYFEDKRERLVKRLTDFNIILPDKKQLNRINKRLTRHKNELFTFLYYPNVDYHNNHAERMIRPNVIFRKITFGNRSPKGILNHSVLMSVLQTAKLNKIDPIKIFQKIFTSPQKDVSAAMLLPP